jgi:YbbR domain-containing protein
MEGETKVNGFFNKDTYIKIIATLIAIVLWFYVLNSDNPYGTKTFIVPLRIENMEILQEKGLYLKNSSTLRRSIEVTFRGRQEVIKTVSVNDFEFILDFSKVKSVNDKYLSIDGPYYDAKDITPVVVSPRSVNIDLERIQNNSFPVQLTTVGEPKAGYKLVNADISLQTIRLEDRESLMKLVDSIKAEIDITGMSEDATKTLECKVYDKQGNVIQTLSKGLTTDVKLSFAREVPVTLVVNGALPDGYVEVQRNATPNKVLIAGTPEIIANTGDIKTLPVNIGGATKSINSKVALKLPEGVRLVNSPGEVTVNIAVEKLLEKEFIINKEAIALVNTDSLHKYTIQVDNVTFKVKGRESDINRLNIGIMRPSLDVSGLAEGISTIPLDVVLPSWVNLIQNVNVDVKIEKIL